MIEASGLTWLVTEVSDLLVLCGCALPPAGLLARQELVSQVCSNWTVTSNRRSASSIIAARGPGSGRKTAEI
jgi:hypothetical protein